MITDIGERLKDYRVYLGKTRKEFAQGVISDTYLVNIENGKSQIRVDHLIAILQNNDISISEFLTDSREKQNEMTSIRNKIDAAFSAHNIQKLQKIADTYSNSLLKFVIQIMIAQLNDQKDNISNDCRVKINQAFWRIDEWDDFYLWVLTKTMKIYNFDSLAGLMNSVFHNYQEFTDYDDETIRLLAKATLNYLQICLARKVNRREIKRVFNYLENLPNLPLIAFEKAKGKYLIAIYDGDQQTGNQLAVLLNN